MSTAGQPKHHPTQLTQYTVWRSVPPPDQIRQHSQCRGRHGRLHPGNPNSCEDMGAGAGCMGRGEDEDRRGQYMTRPVAGLAASSTPLPVDHFLTTACVTPHKRKWRGRGVDRGHSVYAMALLKQWIRRPGSCTCCSKHCVSAVTKSPVIVTPCWLIDHRKVHNSQSQPCRHDNMYSRCDV